MSIHASSSSVPPVSSAGVMGYDGRLLPSTELDGQQAPDAYMHEHDILPHQHEKLEEFFPRAFVRHAADEDELISEADGPTQRGEELGRGSGGAMTSQATSAACVKSSGGRAMALYALSATCVDPYREGQHTNKKGTHNQGRLQP